MANYTLSLSKKETHGKRQILVRAYFGRNCRLRFKSNVFLCTEDFDEVTGSIIIPKDGRLIHERKKECEQAEDKLNSYINQLSHVYKAMLERGDEITVKSVKRSMEITKHISPDKINSYSLDIESVKAEEREREKERVAKKKTFWETMFMYMESRNYASGSERTFKVLIRQLQRYEMFVRATDNERKDFSLDVDTINRETVEDFFDYFRNEKSLSEEYPILFKRMLEEYPAEVSAKHGNATIQWRGHNTYVKTAKLFKWFFGWCNEKVDGVARITENNPFDGWKIGQEKYGDVWYLSLAELNKVADTDIVKAWEQLTDDQKKTAKDFITMPLENISAQRDVFILQCLIGCRVSDLLRLTEDNIVDGEIHYIAKKTGHKDPKTVKVPLNARAVELVEKYQGVDKKGRLMPFISSQKYNDCIKAILFICGMTRKVVVVNPVSGKEEHRPIYEVASSHLARRTFVGCLYEKVQDPSIIGELSGHSENSKAFARYRKITKGIRKATVDLLIG